VELDGPRRGTRDNGLRCAGYVAVADLDPRVADALLATLRDAGIAAYAAPTPATNDGTLESRLPDRPVDRLWVDDRQTQRARELVEDEAAETRAPAVPAEPLTTTSPDPDFDAAWQGVLASLQSTPESPMPAWPDEDSEPADSEAELEPVDPADDAHFVPPPPPPLPRLRPATLAALASIAFGLAILATNFDGGSLTILAVLALFGGLGSLIWNMRNGPPTDSGWDDGAVV
jgi:hypothetical protein